MRNFHEFCISVAIAKVFSREILFLKAIRSAFVGVVYWDTANS